MNIKKGITVSLIVLIFFIVIVAAANILIDPFGAFGDKIFGWYSFDETKNPKIAKFGYLDNHYSDYDSYIIGSSAASSFDSETASLYSGHTCYNLYSDSALPSEYVDEAKYVIKKYHAEQIILVLGIDDVSERETEVNDLSEILHPNVSGKSKTLFFLKLALFSTRYSINKVISYFSDTETPQAFDSIDSETGSYDNSLRDCKRINDTTSYSDTHSEAFSDETGYSLSDIESCINAVSEIKALCTENGTELIIICPPEYCTKIQNTDSESLKEFKHKLCEVSEFWDFSFSSISIDSRYFYDSNHCTEAAANMCLAKVFDYSFAYRPNDFGIYVDSSSVNTLCDSYDDTFIADETEYSIDIPVLMYHHIADEAGDYIVTPKTFRQQLEAIKACGATAVTLDDMYRYVYFGEELPNKPVLITFDDGYYSNYEYSYPIIKELDMNAVIFTIGVSIGHTTYKDTYYEMTPHFGYSEINEMISSGNIDIQSHTYDMHQWEPFEDATPVRSNILKFDGESESDYFTSLRADLSTYKVEFEANTGSSLTALAYPGGQYDELSEYVIHSENIPITFSVGTEHENMIIKGIPQSLYALERMSVDETTDIVRIIDYITKINK